MRVTNDARTLLAQIKCPEGKVLRLEATAPDKLGLVSGEPQHDDLVIEDQGRDLLHVPAAVTAMLANAVIDRVETPEGTGFGISADSGSSAEDGRRP